MYAAIKRALDILVAGSVLVVLLPAMALVFVLVQLESPGPGLFSQQRAGRGGRPFRAYKFRTMRLGGPPNGALERNNYSSGPTFKVWDDPRVTPLGRWLRRFSIDELPQLWNVLAGDMSLVGPRPLEVSEAARVPAWARSRFDVRPGLTCTWQVSGRSLVGFDEWMAMDVAYVARRSLRVDLALLLRTPLAVLSGRGAC